MHGISDEIGEYVDDRTPGELGDVTYYLSTLRRLLELKPAAYNPAAGVEPTRAAEHVHGLVKKFVYHRDVPEVGLATLEDLTEDLIRQFDIHTVHLANWCGREAQRYEGGIERVFDQNIDKLRGRHGSDFDPEANREW
ncbi:MAG: hypothetical protein ABEN55_12015 [Bradymonadaceae bacterium]